MIYFTRRLLILVLALLGFLVFLITTTPGLLTVIKLANVFLPGTLHVQNAQGTLNRQISFDHADYASSDLNIKLSHGALSWQIQSWRQPQIIIHQLRLDTVAIAAHKKAASVEPSKPVNTTFKWPIALKLNTVTIKRFKMDALAIENIKLQGFVDQTHWKIQQFSLDYQQIQMGLTAHGQLLRPYPVFAALNLTPLHASKQAVRGEFNLTGDNTAYRWQGQFTGLFPIKINGFFLPPKNNQLSATFIWGENNIAVSGHLPDQFQVNAYIPKPALFHASLAGLQTTFVAKGTLTNKQQGMLTLTISPGVYQLPKDSALPAIAFQGGRMSLQLTPQALSATGAFTLDREKTLDFNLRLPNINLSETPTSTQAIAGELNLRVNSLDFLQALTPIMDHPHGQLVANLKTSGTIGQPDWQGKITLDHAGVAIPSMGLILNDIQAALTTHNQEWQAQGKFSTPAAQALTLQGQGAFYPSFTGTLALQGDNFPAIKTAEYTVHVSPRLTLAFQPNAYVLSGTILVPHAQLKPLSFSNTVNLTDDAVFVSHEKKAPPMDTNLTTDVQIQMGQDVAIDVQGLHGFLDGAIQIKQTPHNPMSAVGQLTVREGKYQAYGQDLSIHQGQLLFTGGPITNPDIQLRATRSFSNNSLSFTGSDQLFDFNASNLQTIDFGNHLTVGIEVTGHLSAPKIKLFSIPATLSQADILSMLLLGKPANQASKSGGQLLLTAISAMNLDTGTKGMQLLSQLKDSLGFDFNVQSSSQFNQKTNQTSENTAFVVGKSLSKRLYLSYNMGLFEKDNNVLTLKYLLNKFFSLQVTTSDSGNGIDLLYTAQP